VPEDDAPVVRLAVPRGVVDGDRGGDADQLCGRVSDAVCEGIHVLETVILVVNVVVAVCDALAPGDRLVVADAVGCGQ
jgi:hypothetical protein